jgi:hypothetical protein
MVMPGLFPKPPVFPDARHEAVPVCEWVMPAPSAQRRDWFSTCKRLPKGMPDCLEVSIGRSTEGTERCTAAIYGKHAYVIHYDFKPREDG